MKSQVKTHVDLRHRFILQALKTVVKIPNNEKAVVVSPDLEAVKLYAYKNLSEF